MATKAQSSYPLPGVTLPSVDYGTYSRPTGGRGQVPPPASAMVGVLQQGDKLKQLRQEYGGNPIPNDTAILQKLHPTVVEEAEPVVETVVEAEPVVETVVEAEPVVNNDDMFKRPSKKKETVIDLSKPEIQDAEMIDDD